MQQTPTLSGWAIGFSHGLLFCSFLFILSWWNGRIEKPEPTLNTVLEEYQKGGKHG